VIQRIKCIGLLASVGAIQIEAVVNAWIQDMAEGGICFKVLTVDVVIGRKFTMATILYEIEGTGKEEKG